MTQWTFPPEWHPQDWLWIGFPHDADEWPGFLPRAQEQIAAFASAVADSGQQVRLIVRNAANEARARALCSGAVRLQQRAYGDIYLTAHRADLHALLCTLVPEASIAPWWAVFAPAKTPPEVIGRLEGWFNTISSAPENRAPLVALGVEPLPGTSAGTVTLMAESMRSWENITRLARIDPQ